MKTSISITKNAIRQIILVLLAFFVSIPIWASELCFTARENGSKIQIYKTGNPANLKGFSYQINGTNQNNWKPYNFGEEITLNINEKVYFTSRYENWNFQTNGALYQDEDNFCRFKITAGSFNASGCLGNIISKYNEASFNWSAHMFQGLFKDCKGLYTPPYLPAMNKQFGESCYESLFENCENLTETPGFGSTGDFIIKDMPLNTACFKNMFKGCKSITGLKGGLLEKNQMAESCYEGMFQDCTSLITAPEICGDNTGGDMIKKYALVAAPSCFKNMFNGCWKMTNIQGRLGATTMYASCYEGMYMGCRSLKNGPDLPATTLAPSCYASMFEGCSSLEAAPDLVAKTLVASCYESMFSDCRNLKYISVDFTDWNEDDDATTNWVYNVAPKGIFMGPDAITAFPQTDKSHVPVGWICSTPEFLCFEIKSLPGNTGDRYIGLSKGQNLSFKYRVDRNGVAGDWIQPDPILYNDLIIGRGNPTFQVGDRIYIKSVSQDGTLNTSDKTHKFTFNNLTVEVSGNVMSLIDYTMTRKDVPAYTFRDLFSGSGNKITDIKELRIPATELGDHCYENMFNGCTSITVAPVLPALNLGVACYKAMYKGCTSLVTPPSLPATTLKNNCYESMFAGCSALEVAPHLPATELKTGCYNNLFNGCSSLHYISVEFSAWNTSCTSNWVNNVAGTGTFASPDLPQEVGASKWPRDNTHIWGRETYGKDAFCLISGGKAGSRIRIKRVGTPGVTLQYCTKKTPAAIGGTSAGFTEYTDCVFTGEYWTPPAQRAILQVSAQNVFDEAGETVFFRAKEKGTTFNIDEGNYYQFEIIQDEGTDPAIAAKGNIMSLIDPDCEMDNVPEGAFKNLFKECKYLKVAPTMPATTLGAHAYEGMFAGCSGLISTPILKSTTLSESCYAHMFDGCTGLKFIDELPATRLEKGCYEYMFKNCDGLTQEPVLKATILADYCYRGMFEGCDSLKKSPALEASTLFPHCYEDMFKNCSNFQAAPELRSTHLVASCYRGMFANTGITRSPELPAQELAEDCYRSMFENCSNLSIAPVLNAKTLKDGCYYGMFKGCTSLSSAPTLPATTLVRNCYREMFENCGDNFISMKVDFTEWPDKDLEATTNWVNGVADRGAFICPKVLGETPIYGPSNIPLDPTLKSKQWTIINDFLCFTNMHDRESVVSLTIPDGFKLLYSSSETFTKEDPWQEYQTGDKITLSKYGDKVFFKAPDKDDENKDFENKYFSRYLYVNKDGKEVATEAVYKFTIPKSSFVYVSGHLLSLLKENYTEIKSFPYYENGRTDSKGNKILNNSYIFSQLFLDCEGLIDASELKLPDFVSPNCYSKMFMNCKKLRKAPILPSTEVANYCYASMFYYCNALQEAPKLPATTLATACYQFMYYQCKELLTAPALPAAVLANSCYKYMFARCSSMKKAPKIEAETLDAESCLQYMFMDCKKLNEIDVNFTKWNPNNYSQVQTTVNGKTQEPTMPTYQWVSNWGNYTSEGQFRCPKELPTGNGYIGSNYVPKGWIPGLNIIATIPDEEGKIPEGYPTTEPDGSTCNIKHHYELGGDNDADVLYINGDKKITIVTPNYARVQEIGIYGTSAIGDNEGTVNVVKYNEDGTTEYYSSKSGEISLKPELSTPSDEIVFVISDQAASFNEKDKEGNLIPVIHSFTIEFNHGFYGKIILYGEAKPYCEKPIMNFDYKNNQLTITAQAGASIYWSDDKTNLQGTDLSGFEYDGQPVPMSWVEEAEGFKTKTYYAVAVIDGLKEKSLISEKTVAAYSPKMSGYCLVDEEDGMNLRQAITYAYYASSYEYPVKIFVPNGTYDIGNDPLEIKDYVSLIGESCDETIIQGNGDAVVYMNGYDSYLQDMTIDHLSGGTAVRNRNLNTLKIQIAENDRYEDIDGYVQMPNWTRTGDQDQINVIDGTCNGHAINMNYPRGIDKPTPTAFLINLINKNTGLAEGYVITEGNNLYIREDFSKYYIEFRAANERGGFGDPKTIEQVTEKEDPTADPILIMDEGTTRLKLNAYGYATFSFNDGEHDQLQAIGASAYYALYQNEKIRLEQINKSDIIPAGTGVVLFGAPNDYVDFYTTGTSARVTVPTENVLVAVTEKGWTNNGEHKDNIYVLNNNKVKKLKVGNSVSCNRAYFDLTNSNSSGAASYRMVFGRWFDEEVDFENESTEITIVELAKPAIEYIGTYTLTGTKTPEEKGLLIKNGKVVLQK